MKTKLLSTFLIASLAIGFTSCMKLKTSEDDGSKKNNTNVIKEIIAPDDFDWKMSKTVTCDFTSTADRSTMVSVSLAKDGASFATFYVGGGADKVEISLPIIATELYVSYAKEIGFSTPVKIAVSNNVVSYSVPSDAKEYAAETKSANVNYRTKAAGTSTISYPASGWGTLMFEDLWPSYGDYDFNDMVLGYQVILYPNNKNKVKDIAIGLKLRCVGGSLPYKLFFRIKGLKGGEVDDMYLNEATEGVDVVHLNSGNPVKDDALFEMMNFGSNKYYNNGNNNLIAADKMLSVTIVLELRNSVAISDLSESAFDFFIVNKDQNNKEIHLPDNEPVFDANAYWDIVGKSSVTKGSKKYYYSNTNLVWAIRVPKLIRHTYEGIDFNLGYPDFIQWIKSGGKTNQNWYTNSVKENLIPDANAI